MATMLQTGSLALTVTVVTRNRASVLRQCIAALIDQSLPPTLYEIIIVDDASADETPAVVAAAQQQARCAIRSVRLATHRGVAVARNVSMREARAAVIAFVDSDSLVPPQFLAAHLAAHQASPDEIVARGPITAIDRLERPFQTRRSVLDLNTSFFDTDNASAPKAALMRAGLFDEQQFPYGWVGLDMGLRLRSLGLRRRYLPNAPSYHYQPPLTADTLAGALRKEEDRARNASRFSMRHPTLEVRLMTSQTPFHRWLNALQRGFGLVHAGNLITWVERSRAWGAPALGRVLTAGVLNERYLSRLREFRRSIPAPTTAAVVRMQTEAGDRPRGPRPSANGERTSAVTEARSATIVSPAATFQPPGGAAVCPPDRVGEPAAED